MKVTERQMHFLRIAASHPTGLLIFRDADRHAVRVINRLFELTLVETTDVWRICRITEAGRTALKETPNA